MNTRVIRTRKRGYPHTGWAWEGIVADFERALEIQGATVIGSAQPNELYDIIGRVCSRLGIGRMAGGTTVNVLGMMGTKPRLAFPHGLRGKLVMFVWDCWPTEHGRWSSIFKTLKPDYVFFTSRSAAEYWSPLLGNDRVEWLPEAIDPAHYAGGAALEYRTVGLLEMGRKHPKFHAEAVEIFVNRSEDHFFSTDAQPFLFPDRDSLVRGIQSARMLACFPASTTHPHGRAAGAETMTYRYLEAVASKTVIVGKVPAEMVDLFGFTPGVNAEPQDWRDVVVDVLDNPRGYQSMVDRAYERLREVATWELRAETILSRVS